MLEEVEMPPRVRLGVVHLAPRRAALRAREAGALPEVNPQIQTTSPGIELDVHDLPPVVGLAHLCRPSRSRPSSSGTTPQPSEKQQSEIGVAGGARFVRRGRRGAASRRSSVSSRRLLGAHSSLSADSHDQRSRRDYRNRGQAIVRPRPLRATEMSPKQKRREMIVRRRAVARGSIAGACSCPDKRLSCAGLLASAGSLLLTAGSSRA